MIWLRTLIACLLCAAFADAADWPQWLGEMDGDHAALMRPAVDGLLRVWPVDRRVGSPRNNGPELLEAIAA